MIQDIAPKKMLNQYQNYTVEDEDAVLCYRGTEVCVGRDEENHLLYPRRKDFPDAPDEKFRFLFQIDTQRYFLFLGSADEMNENAHAAYPMETVRLLRQEISLEQCFAAATGYHLHQWYRDNRFCGRCGERLVHAEKERMLRCQACGNEVYPKIAPAVIVGVRDGSRLLLTKYAGRAYKLYALIAGFTEIGESVEETVAREVMEEVGLSVKNIRYWGSQPWGTDQDLLLGFFCDLDGEDRIQLDQEELSTAQWFEREEIPIGDDHVSLTRAMVEAFKRGEDQ